MGRIARLQGSMSLVVRTSVSEMSTLLDTGEHAKYDACGWSKCKLVQSLAAKEHR